jgi:hypothetical protein
MPHHTAHMRAVPPAAPTQVAGLQYNTLANGHGPILRYNVEELVNNYKQWSLAVEKGTTQARGVCGGGGVCTGVCACEQGQAQGGWCVLHTARRHTDALLSCTGTTRQRCCAVHTPR